MSVVTGANGFLGAYVVVALLKKGLSVKALKRSSSDLSEFNYIASLELKDTPELINELEWVDADVLDVLSLDEAFQNEDFVFHCAADVSFKGNLKSLLKTNAEGTANVVNACLKANVKKLVHVSSTAAIGRTDSNALITEKSMWREDDNNTAYAVSKHLAELEVWRGVEEGLNAVIVNPGIIIGSGDWSKGSCKLFLNIKNGFRFYTRGVNGFVWVKDVAKTMMELCFSDINAKRFLVVSENISYKQLFEGIAKNLNVKAPSIEIKLSYIPWLKWPLKVYSWYNRKTNLSAETLKTSVKQHRYSNDAIIKTGFVFTPLEEVIEHTCRDLKRFSS
jgi:nucleoside-diphosphate-sugar epimerase